MLCTCTLTHFTSRIAPFDSWIYHRVRIMDYYLSIDNNILSIYRDT